MDVGQVEPPRQELRPEEKALVERPPGSRVAREEGVKEGAPFPSGRPRVAPFPCDRDALLFSASYQV